MADAAMREALSAVQGVVDKARSYVAEIATLQARKAEPAPQSPAPATSQSTSLMTEASANVLIEYLKHFFDLVSMQNRLLERRLDSLEELLSRLDQHVTEDAAEISTRLSNLEGVQLPLVKSAEKVEAEPAMEPRAEDLASEELEREDVRLAARVWAEPEAATTEEEPGSWTPQDEPQFEATEQTVAAELSGMAAPEVPHDLSRDEVSGPQPVGRPGEPPELVVGGVAKAEAAIPGGVPVHGTLQFQGLVSFQSLFAIRDELRRREAVFSAEAASFEGGRGELRFRAERALVEGEIVAALVAATGQEFVATGPFSYQALRGESREA